MATLNTRSWIAFFQDAGIQDHALAARYAAIFVDNEIHSSMLKELDMELLRVMGISKVGHVLGILKHAKHVHDTQLFADSQPSPAGGNNSSGTSSPIVITNNDNNTVKKIRTTGTPDRLISPAAKSARSKVTERLGSVAVSVGTQNRPNSTVRVASARGPEPQVSRSVVRPNNTDMEPKIKVTDRLGAKSVVQTVKRKMITYTPNEVQEEIPIVKKVRRVLPEHEGGYSIRLPSGSTPRSREILAKLNARQPGTVFDRLGEAAVSSTTEVDEPTITITGFGTQIVKSPSVFSRLGGKGDPVPTPSTPPQAPSHGVKARLGQQVNFNRTTPTITRPTFKKQISTEGSGCPIAKNFKTTITKNTNHVQYAGILKKPTPNIQSRLGNKQQVVKSSANSTTLTMNSSAGILGNPTNAMKLSAKERLDLSKSSSKNSRQTKTRKFIVTNKKTGMKTIVYKMVDDDEDAAPHLGTLNSGSTAGPSYGRQGFSAY